MRFQDAPKWREPEEDPMDVVNRHNARRNDQIKTGYRQHEMIDFVEKEQKKWKLSDDSELFLKMAELRRQINE